MKNECKRGHELTDQTRISRFRNGRRVLQGCKICARQRSKDWHQDNKEKASKQSRDGYLLNRTARLKRMKERQCLVKHGITLEQRSMILEQQDYCCANFGCCRGISKKGGHLDHNHKTGKIRGILCPQCNMVLGLVDDSCERLAGLVQYLQDKT